MGRMVAQIPNEDPERIKRVLDAKWRTIGIDKDSLSQQVDEKKGREKAERDRDLAFAKLSRYFDDQLTIQQQEADKLRSTINRDVDSFREGNQLKHTRREWDLNRPDGKKLDGPARIGDDDPRLGSSSLQKFDGEDLAAGDRKAAQMEQARLWWEQQAAEKAAMKAAEKEAEAAYGELTRYQDALQHNAKAEETLVRKHMNQTTVHINRHLADEKKLREAQSKNVDLAANMAEMEATINSGFMTEDPNMAASALSAYRVRKDHYKGMTEAERQAILDTQLAQMEENKAKRAAQQLEDLVYARTQHDIMRALDEQARNVEDFKKAQMARAADILKKQMEEKAHRDKSLSDLYRNQIDPSYFLQFGTSHR